MKRSFLLFILLTIGLPFLSKAAIHFTDINDTTIVVPDSVNHMNFILIDINQDSNPDYKIMARYFQSWEGYHPPYESFIITVVGLDSNQVSQGPFFDSDTISSSTIFETNGWICGTMPGYGALSKWYYLVDEPDTFAYVGLKFLLNDNIYYGWLKLKTDGYPVTIDGFAFNNQRNQLILAGQTY